MEKILVIAPHCDDEVLSCGASINKHKALGSHVTVLIMTNASKGAPEIYSETFIKNTRDQTLKAHKILGVDLTIFEDLPAPELDQYPLRLISDKISNYLNKIKPSKLYIPFYNDAHIDHQIISSASNVASRPIKNLKIKEIFFYETLSETEWSLGSNSDKFYPNYFEVVSKKNVSSKVRAFKQIKTQLKQSPHPRSLENILNLAKFRGSNISENYSEAFMTLRMINK